METSNPHGGEYNEPPLSEKDQKTRGYSQQYQGSTNKENFRGTLKDLSPEDRAILKNISREANIYRAYPYAAFCGGLAYFGVKTWLPKFSFASKLGLSMTAGIVGMFVGKVTYLPTALKNLENELPPDSKLRQMIESAKEQANVRMQEAMKSPQERGSFPMQQQYSVRNDENSQSKPHQSYAQRRKAHREQEKNLEMGTLRSSQPDTSLQSEFVLDDYSKSQTDKKVRYNKYGDPILD